ncbi:ATP-binding protein [Streptomyces sp. H27-D2]|uniref:ATP-binding protein n=1 Tax=Streptomyces sp. H27-D2 TaxID=3046304 RepID=UPI002DBEC774|nr:ATP-binding protein [Streptomyces sp. H27-D2]MEC4020535.1 ATP-binding protein [Streptomyces sp. H27-D2]
MSLHVPAAAFPPPSDPPDDWEYALRISNCTLGPGIARAHVRTVLRRHGLDDAVIDNAELLASELTTNSVRHASGPVSVRLSYARTEQRLRLSVWDSNPRLPDPLPGRPDAEHGRGRWLLRQCAVDRGHYILVNGLRATGGKEVWAEWKAARLREH